MSSTALWGTTPTARVLECELDAERAKVVRLYEAGQTDDAELCWATTIVPQVVEDRIEQLCARAARAQRPRVG